MKQEHGFLCIGSGGSMPYDVESIDIEFNVYQRATIEKARELIIMATRKLQKIVNAHKKIRPYLREYPFGSRRAFISLSFCKENHEHYADGSIAYIFHSYNQSLDRDILCYFIEDPEADETVNLFDEPYEEAEKIVDNKNTQKENSQI